MFINVKEKFNIGFLFLSIFCLGLLYLPKDNILFTMLLYSNDDSLSSLSDIYLSDEYSVIRGLAFLQNLFVYSIRDKRCAYGSY